MLRKLYIFLYQWAYDIYTQSKFHSYRIQVPTSIQRLMGSTDNTIPISSCEAEHGFFSNEHHHDT